MKLKFRVNQFIDTIYYYDYKHHYIVIDSTKGKYFYGTEIILFDNGKYGYVGASRFTKNKDPRNGNVPNKLVNENSIDIQYCFLEKKLYKLILKKYCR